MYRFLKILSLVLLAINGIGACYGGLSLIIDPSGNTIRFPEDTLNNSPFDNYLIPGIVLFVVNGLLSILTFIFILIKHKMANTLLIIQGILLGGWICMQMLLLQMFFAPFHVPFLLIGVIFILSGFYLRKQDKLNTSHSS